MKRPGILMTAILSLALFSCSRDADSDMIRLGKTSIEGNWRMVLVKDNVSGLSYAKPGATPGDVEITFVAVTIYNGFINGRTPTNSVYGDYKLYRVSNDSRITIPSMSSTDVVETSWGLNFLYNIMKSDSYSIEPDGKLRIHTEKKTLYFERN
jgi:hypothetical protein